MGQQMIDKFKDRAVNSGATSPSGDKQQSSLVNKMPLRELLNETKIIISKPRVISPLSKGSSSTDDTTESTNVISRPQGSASLSLDRGTSVVETRNLATKAPGGSPLAKDTRPASVAAMLSGSKRKHTDSLSTSSGLQPPSKNGTNGPLVYVRRKLDTEPGKLSTSSDVRSAISHDLRKCVNDGTKEPNGQKQINQETRITLPESLISVTTPLSSQASPDEELPPFDLAGKPVTAMLATQVNSTVPSKTPNQTVELPPSDFTEKPVPGSPATSSSSTLPGRIPTLVEKLSPSGLAGNSVTGLPGTPIAPSMTPTEIDRPSSKSLDWQERFIQLQMFLKRCDQSSQENYIMKLRALSAAGRSRHAVELEKRAIQLLVEEGIELHRMKNLNVLGKALPKESLSTQIPCTPEAQIQADNKLGCAAKFPV